ncbi:MAG: RNA polymerase sigma factor, partial [Gaiellaceae bacterium]
MDGRQSAIEELYRTRHARFRDVLSCLTGSRQTAHGAVQEAFALALRDCGAFRGEGSLEAWVWTIAIRTAHRQRRALALPAEAHQAPATTNGAVAPAPPWRELDPALADAVRSLPPRQRLMVFLRYFADLPYAQIAEVCGVAEGTVAATLAQARSALLERLTEKEYHRSRLIWTNATCSRTAFLAFDRKRRTNETGPTCGIGLRWPLTGGGGGGGG